MEKTWKREAYMVHPLLVQSDVSGAAYDKSGSSVDVVQK